MGGVTKIVAKPQVGEGVAASFVESKRRFEKLRISRGHRTFSELSDSKHSAKGAMYDTRGIAGKTGYPTIADFSKRVDPSFWNHPSDQAIGNAAGRGTVGVRKRKLEKEVWRE